MAPPGASWQKTGVLRNSFHSILCGELEPIGARALKASRYEHLPEYVAIAVHSLQATLARLRDLPMSYRDLVLQFTQAQRLGLDLLAMEEYHRYMFQRMIQRQRVYPLRPEFMGCYTTNPTTVENMHHAGLPVVYIRSSALVRPSQLRVRRVLSNFAAVPTGIETEPWPGTPCRILHVGASGTRRMQMSRPHGRYFEDLPSLPDLQEEPPDMTPFLLDEPLRPPSGPNPLASDDSPSAQDFDDEDINASRSQSHLAVHRLVPASKNTVHGGGVSKSTKCPNSRADRKAKQRSRAGHMALISRGPPLPSQPNRNKWAPPPSELMPAMCVEWRTALGSVNRGSHRQRTVSKARAGLMYPDPTYLVSVAPQNRAMVIAAWLSIRPARCGQMLYPSSPLMPVIPAAVWRQFFWLYRRQPRAEGDLSAAPADTGDPAVDEELDAATAAAKAMFGTELVATMSKTSREVFWKGRAYDVVDGGVVGMGTKPIREILWELAELSWRYELLTLDKFAAPHMWLGPDAAASRSATILLVFPDSPSFVLTNSPFPTCNFSISAPARADRLKAFTSLRRVMSDWQGCPVAIKEAMADYVPSSPECHETRVVEAQTMLFYCQSFFEYFRRAPILPCQLPT